MFFSFFLKPNLHEKRSYEHVCVVSVKNDNLRLLNEIEMVKCDIKDFQAEVCRYQGKTEG